MHHLRHCAEKHSATKSSYFQQQDRSSYHEVYKNKDHNISEKLCSIQIIRKKKSPVPLVSIIWF